MPSDGFKRVLSATLALFLLTLTRADVGGGSGKPVTPYSPNENLTVELIESVRNESSKARQISTLELHDGTTFIGRGPVALMYVKDGRPNADALFQFRGRSDNESDSSVDFSDVQKVWVDKLEDGILSSKTVTFILNVLPTIKPADLLAKKPTYQQLVDDYTTTVSIRMPLQMSGKELCFVTGTPSKGYKLLASVRTLKLKREIDLTYDKIQLNGKSIPSIWWAIPSVTADPAYPNRIRLKH